MPSPPTPCPEYVGEVFATYGPYFATSGESFAYGTDCHDGFVFLYMPRWNNPYVITDSPGLPKQVTLSIGGSYFGGLPGGDVGDPDSAEITGTGTGSAHLTFYTDAATDDYGAWTPDIGSCWTGECWARDTSGGDATGTSVVIGWGNPTTNHGFRAFPVPSLTLDTSWQFFRRSFTIADLTGAGAVVATPVFGMSGSTLRRNDTRNVEFPCNSGHFYDFTKQVMWGTIEFACMRMYPCGSGPQPGPGPWIKTRPRQRVVVSS